MRRWANWTEKASGAHELKWLASFDVDDPTMNCEAMRQWCHVRGITACVGYNRTKIEAINADMEHAGAFDVLILVSDDMAVRTSGWDKIIWDELSSAFPDLNGALWLPDGLQLRLCTLSIMGRPVYEDLGCIYDRRFKSTFCDDYFQSLMIRSNRLRFVDRDVFRHEHKVHNNDELMIRNEGDGYRRYDQLVYCQLTTIPAVPPTSK